MARCRGLLGILQEMEITRKINGALWSYKKADSWPGLTENQNVVQCAARASDTLMIQELWSSDHCLRLIYPCSSESTIVTQLLVYLHLFLFLSDSVFPTSWFLLPQRLFWDFESHPSGSLLFSPARNLLFVSFKDSRRGYVWVHWLLSSSEHLLWAKFSNWAPSWVPCGPGNNPWFN